MKNATSLHEGRIGGLLQAAGCTQVHLENGSLVALRPGRDGRLYPLSIELYEDDSAPAGSSRRFRARASRRFGLPVTCAHGDCPEVALSAVEWTLLDVPPSPQPVAPLAGVV
jgi:hypothetical protein